MIRKALLEVLQRKNSLMFITSLVFMLGIIAFFNNSAIILATILTILSIILIIKNIISIKYIIFWLLIFYFGFFLSVLKIHSSDELVKYAPSSSKIVGQIISIPNSNIKNKTKFFVKVSEIDGERIQAKTLVTAESDTNDFNKLVIGNTYEFNGQLRTPFKAGNPSQFDYSKYLRNFDTFTVYYVNEDNINQLNSQTSPKWKFIQNLNTIRTKIISTHAQTLKSPYLELLGGIVFGDDAIAPPDYIKTSFVNSGLLHILAASGMNVAFIYGFWFFFVRKLKVPYKLSVISGILLIVLYTFMTGLGPSVIRAALMLIIILIGKLIDRDTHSISLLSFVAMIMLIYNPAYINDVGFQLSFLVTFGILATGNVLFEKLKEIKVPEWISGSVLLPVVAQIWVAPIQMFYFNTFSTYSIFANILSVPFISVVSFGGFVSSIFATFSPYTKFICIPIDFILNFLLKGIVFISTSFANFPNSLIETTHPSVLQISIYYSIVILLTIIIKNHQEKQIIKKLGITSLILILGLLITIIKIPNHKLELITFDVQNADCFLIKSPDEKYFIIDTGRSPYKTGKSQASSTIIKYLKDRGIKNIEGLIITHFDTDHAGGAYDIIKNLNVKEVYLNSSTDQSPTAQLVYKALQEHKKQPQIINSNQNIYKEENSFNIKVFYANIPYTSKNKKDIQSIENENSIISLIQYKNFDILFMGDAGIKAYQKIEKQIPTNIEVLKVGHHGGKNTVNQSMLNKINNQVSIISTGKNNFGHPNNGTLNELRNTEIYRTDYDNSIKLTSDGISYDISVFDKTNKQYILSKKYTSK